MGLIDAEPTEIGLQFVRDRINIAIGYLDLIAENGKKNDRIRAANARINLDRALDMLRRLP